MSVLFVILLAIKSTLLHPLVLFKWMINERMGKKAKQNQQQRKKNSQTELKWKFIWHETKII